MVVNNFKVTLNISYESETPLDINTFLEQHVDVVFEEMRDCAENFATCLTNTFGLVKKQYNHLNNEENENE